MEVKVTSTEQMIQLLNNWYHEILSQNVVHARKFKVEIDEKIATMEVDPSQTLFIYYSLLCFRYQILINQLWEARYTLNKIDFEKTGQTDDFLSYYYNFFKAIYATTIGRYKEAKMHYRLAENLLKQFPDDIEKAEFNYKVATFYYHIRQPLHAVNHALKAKEFFENKKGYEIKIAGCENIVGLASTSLKQYREAEENFLSALTILNNYGLHIEQFDLMIRYNLGLLYAEQNLSEKAITHLKNAFEDEGSDYKTTFLIAREYLKLGDRDVADEWISRGSKIAGELQNEEYEHHFAILRVFNHLSHPEQLEETIEAAITFFDSQHLWGYIQDYAEKVASEFYKVQHHEKASKYFHLALEAKSHLYREQAN
ncbi:tetratricopeptide repeat protein [Fictibacillus nanhaiensis]|uniref:response regulator aspartate phosphatase n=1 Tax=Fictibacillus nanhaiensis TaxID=742169 RepID=UPI001C988D12|nr:tetratricopeptide repeat protein [Fictibacillus nanhaiensis]MBY6036798.1 tetratricopeptide repeat protein [Fictibacillus nanhaiensis]